MIRPVTTADHDAIWSIVEPAIRAGETLAIPRDMSREEALRLWTSPERTVRLLEEDGEILGVFYILANQAGGGSHVANAAYVTASHANGRGVARRMCAASLDLARQQGYRAMQFNFVIATNHRAVALWQAMGFGVIGRLPAVFDHPKEGLVDAFVMHRFL
ncbi:GNAT family N-acetyltransferase [Sphingobium sp. Sx8-8]|uniref:GNAT family N-acetyltransferase n=1 Tax=Sphingobium sp. Sx8-8 TaxID=2933617 RepID=UPI001F5A3D6A|nr:GNAT family N-acetyltransferase [Sphingobium sp. Sx8-8]